MNTFDFYNKASFQKEAMQNWNKIASETNGTKILPPKKEIEKGFNAYKIGKKITLPFVILGEADLRTDKDLLQNVGTLSTDPQFSKTVMADLLEKMNHQKPTKKTVEQYLTYGSVINDSNWWIFRNDMFMLGTAHAGKEFLLASVDGKIPADDLLWDASNKRPRALGRELLILSYHEYQCVKSDDLGYAFQCPCGPRQNLTLEECRKRLITVQSVDEIKKLFV